VTPVLFLLTALALAPVELRGGATVDAPVESVSLAGVSVGGPAPRTISWRRVSAVTGPHARDAEPYAEFAEDVWRALSRLDRADVHGALVLLPDLEDRCENEIGPTPADVFTASCEAHQRAVDYPAALRAFFELSRLVDDPADFPRHALDPVTGLSVTLAPFLTPEHARRAQPHLAPRASDTPRIARLRASYAAAIAADPALLPPGGSESPAELLLARLARAQNADEQAVRELRAWADDTDEPWRRAWASAAAARALLASTDPSEVRRGALEFLSIPAFDAAESPYLAGLALAESADALERLGETAPANALRAELARLSPDHPALADTGDDAP